MTRNRAQALAFVVSLAVASPTAYADAVADWNRIALDAVVASSRSPEQALKEMAMVHAAMFEALNFVEPRYKSQYTVASQAQPGAPRAAVAAGAAHHILVELYPARAVELKRALTSSLSAVADQQAAYAAAITGRSIAQIVWAVRASDHPSAAFERTSGRARWDIDLRSLNSAIAGLIESQRLDSLESARVHALASGAAADAIRSPAEAGASVSLRTGSALQAALLEGRP